MIKDPSSITKIKQDLLRSKKQCEQLYLWAESETTSSGFFWAMRAEGGVLD